MADTDYPGRTILLAFYFKFQRAGSASERKALSQQLFDRFNGHIINECAGTTPQIDPTPRVRATIAVIAENAPGSTPLVKARRGVQAYFSSGDSKRG